eukprot:scaffold681206_cov42-Prasinocladus_malaysianus.AAC.1
MLANAGGHMEPTADKSGFEDGQPDPQTQASPPIAPLLGIDSQCRDCRVSLAVMALNVLVTHPLGGCKSE